MACGARPQCTTAGERRPSPEWRCSSLYQAKNSCEKERASWRDPKRSGKPGRYFRVRKWLSEYGLSSETWGRLWVLVIPRSAIRKATGLDVIEEPRSA